MSGETDLSILLKNMTPLLNDGDYAFCTIHSLNNIDINDIIASFKEAEGITLILKKETADKLKLDYSYIAALDNANHPFFIRSNRTYSCIRNSTVQ